ncbi:MAG TPA: hypothetical protein VKX33_10190 [Cyclobacteriaceae bacterium]|nr:hypothetical protein [Cyclobacteriaceae bacterium]
MLNTLIKNISPDVLAAVTEKFGLNQEMGSKAVDATSDSLQNSVSDEITKGNLDGLLSMFNSSGNATENHTFQSLASRLSGDYIQKLGLAPETATQISQYVLPLVLAKISTMLGGTVDKDSLANALGKGGLLSKAGDLLGGLGNIFKK